MAIKYLVALPIPEPVLGVLVDIKAGLRPTGWRDTMEPHITVLAPDRPLLAESDAATAFQRACSGLLAFTVRASQLRHFARRDQRAIYLNPVPAKPLHELFETLLTKATWQETESSSRRSYHPHITLVTQLPTQAAMVEEEQLQSLNLDLSFKISKICLYAKEKSWPSWKILAECELH